MTQQNQLMNEAERLAALKVVRDQTTRIKFWLKLKEYCDTQYLKSHGWIQVRDGWLLPSWHPKLQGKTHFKGRVFKFTRTSNWIKDRWIDADNRKTPNLNARDYLGKQGPLPEVGEPYDLNHALNSQRAHTQIRSIEAMLPNQLHKAPTFPSYVTWRPFQLSLTAIGNLAGIAAFLLNNHWSSSLFWLSAATFTLASIFVAWKTRRDWELDWAESQLNRGVTHEVQRPN